jgi:hypothetical protein
MHKLHAPYGTFGHTAVEPFELTADSKRLRRYFEEYFMTNGAGPDFQDIMSTLKLSESDMWEALHQLEQGVQVMFVPGTETLVKMPPFSYVPTRYRVSIGDSRRWYAGCAGEASAINSLFPGRTVYVDSICPDCYDGIRLQYRDGQLLSLDPPDTVIHIGIRPDRFIDDWIVACDNINFFRSMDHVEVWEDARPDVRGVSFPAELGLRMVEKIAKSRYWDYDRGPDVGRSSMMRENLRSWGIDVTAWDDE